MRIAIDVMGGDFAPREIIKGVSLALHDFPDIEKFLLAGKVNSIRKEFERSNISHLDTRIEIAPATQVVRMGDPSSVALRSKKDSSISVAAKLMKDGSADAVVSAGHTGAAVATLVVNNRMLPGIDRPGIASVFPAPRGPFVLLDIGANVDSKPLHLAQYALMGESYSQLVLGIENPRVGLLSNGGEDKKGNELTRQTHKILEKLPLNFIGNIEGRDLFFNNVDVAVCDGFVGNVVLKSCEGLAKAISGILSENLKKTPVRMAGALLTKNAFIELKELIDHEEYGGAPLLGVNGICIIAHGSSSSKAIRNAIRVSRDMVNKQFNQKITEKIGNIDWEKIKQVSVQ